MTVRSARRTLLSSLGQSHAGVVMREFAAKRRRPQSRTKRTVGLVLLAVGVPLIAGQAIATVSNDPSTGGYEVDGNLVPGNDSPTGLDWTGTLTNWTRTAGVCAGPTGAPALPILICDPVKSD